MNKIELEVRIALANDFALRAKEVCSNPGRAAAIRLRVEDTVGDVLNDLKNSGTISASDVCGLKSKISSIMLESYTPQGVSSSVADMWMKGTEFYKCNFELLLENVKEEGLEIPAKFETIYELILNILGRRDNVVSSLVRKAEESGLEDATCTESLHTAIKQEYQTSDDYVSATQNLGGTVSDLLTALPGMQNNPIFTEVIPKIVDKLCELSAEYFLKEDIEAIYQK